MGGTHLIGTFWIDSCQMVSRQWGILELAPIDQHWGGYSFVIQNKTNSERTLRIDATGIL
jgi:hypothetical protein